jgi:hypothetical protein
VFYRRLHHGLGLEEAVGRRSAVAS